MSEAVKYAVVSGLVGANFADSPPPATLKPSLTLTHPLSGIESVIPYTKYMILLERSKLMDFLLREFKTRIWEIEINKKTRKNALCGAFTILNKPAKSR